MLVAYPDLCEKEFHAAGSSEKYLYVYMNIFYTLVLPVMMSVVSTDVLDTGQQVVQKLRRQRSNRFLKAVCDGKSRARRTLESLVNKELS